MAHVQKRGANRWMVTYKGSDGKRHSKSFGRKLDADRFLATVTVDVMSGTWIDPDAGRVTVQQYAERWLSGRDIRPSTRERYESWIGFVNRLGDRPLASLTPSDRETWQAGLVRDMARSTAHGVRGIFAAMLKTAVRDRVIARSPFLDVRTITVEKTLVVPMPIETILATRDSISRPYGAAVMVGAGCGLRRGECMGLTVDRVDFLRRILTIDRQLVSSSQDHAPIFGPPKTASSVRKVPMPQTVVDALAAHLAEFPPGDHGLVFTAPRGGPVTRAKFGPSWRASAAPAGSRFHDLRHFYASALIEQGESVKVVQARLGHKTAQETLDTYGHLFPNSEDSTRRAIDAVFAPPTSESEVAK